MPKVVGTLIRFNVTCDYKCNFHVLRSDESPTLVAAKANEADMVTAFKSYFSPSVNILKSEDELAKFKKSNPVFALALLKVNHITVRYFWPLVLTFRIDFRRNFYQKLC